MPEEGLLMSEKLAEVLGARIGDEVRVEVLDGRRPAVDVPIRGLVTDFAGVAAYMDIDALRRLLKEGDTVNGAYLAVDHKHWDDFMREVKDTPRAAFVHGETRPARRLPRDHRQEHRHHPQALLRARHHRRLRRGLQQRAHRPVRTQPRAGHPARRRFQPARRCAAVLVGELAMLVLLALPAGLLFGRGLALFIMSSFSTETVRLPIVINDSTYSIAVGGGAHRRRLLVRARQPHAGETRPRRRLESTRLIMPPSSHLSMANQSPLKSEGDAPWETKRGASGKNILRRSLPWLGLLALVALIAWGLVAETRHHRDRRGRPRAPHRPGFRGGKDPHPEPLRRRRPRRRQDATRPAQARRSGGGRKDRAHHHRAGRRSAARSPRPHPGGGRRLHARGRPQTGRRIARRRPRRPQDSPRRIAIACARSHATAPSRNPSATASAAEAAIKAAEVRAAEFSLQVIDYELAQARAVLERPDVSTAGNLVEVKSPVSGRVLNVMQESETIVSPGTADPRNRRSAPTSKSKRKSSPAMP